MKIASSLLTSVALAGILAVWDVPLKPVNPLLGQASAAEMKDATGLTTQQKIDLLIKHKGQFGSGDELRRFFFGDLEPLAIQPGGAGMVVNLYNKANNVTISYCSTYDVVIAVKKGKVAKFEASEVK
ncbi:hypothetical protein [Cylindrospermum sp. FACHB-282]|uniref:hypothetical protein n=1 Tax=Cylindrospermum sp. FACHB-282 TaxID=2692794 RepID=UPI00168445D9|nr:hypothetical protein [Cylindrospermum sp. FACHB-282]MBD2386950.1 hypothetical protein [Cylindrospermum sp. FACHB-282]